MVVRAVAVGPSTVKQRGVPLQGAVLLQKKETADSHTEKVVPGKAMRLSLND